MKGLIVIITNKDLVFLKRAINLAKTALEKGEEPFGSVLVNKDGVILFEDHNRVSKGDHTRHPEFEIAKWAMNNLNEKERRTSTVYTSGEHCPMCAAAHGWAKLGRIVYAASSKQLSTWLDDLGFPKGYVKPLPITDVIDNVIVEGPVLSLSETVRALHTAFYNKNRK